MKSFFVGLVMLLCIPVQSQVKWDGEGNDGKWSNSTNWVGNNLPALGDQVVLDNSFRTGNFTVTLPDSSVTILSLSISPLPGNVIHLILPSSNTITSNAFVATGTGYGLMINSGGLFQNSSGATSGTVLSISDSLCINNGGLYKHNTRSAHAGYVSILSRTPGTENGIFEFDVPSPNSYAVSISNRVYGMLVLSATAAGGLKSYFSSGSNPFKIRGDWQINSGVTYGLDLDDTVFVEGNFTQHPSSKFNLANGTNSVVLFLKRNITFDTLTKTGTGSPQIHIAGNINQTIASTADVLYPGSWLMNNSSGAKMTSDFSLSSGMILLAGKISLGANTVSVTAIQNASSNRYIITDGSGFLKMPVGSNPVVFPIGPDSVSYNPVTLTNGGGITYSIRVDTGINPIISFPTNGINRTWNIFTSANPATPVTVSFQYNASHANPGCAPAGHMELLKYIPYAWNIISSDLLPSGNDPFIVTSQVNSFNSPFAIGRNGGWTLPLQLVYIDAVKAGSSIHFKWILSTGTTTDSKMELEISQDGINFNTLATIIGRESTKPYHYVSPLETGTTYYRLRLIDASGIISFSRVIRISHEVNRTYITSVNSILMQDVIHATLISPFKQKVRLIIMDLSGRIIKNQDQQLNKGRNDITVHCNNCSSGLYYLIGLTTVERTNIIQFIKL